MTNVLNHTADHMDAATPTRCTVRAAVVTYNASSFIEDCLQALVDEAEALGPDVHLDIRVVDNASRDDTCDRIERSFPHVTLDRRAGNDGFAVSTNRSLADLDFDYGLVINPDCVIRPGTLQTLIARCEEESAVGVVGPRLERADGTLDHAAKRNLPRIGSSARYLLLKVLGRAERSRSGYLAPQVGERDAGDVEAVNGAFMLIRRDALLEVGLLDEAFWMYGEDLDWCRRFLAAGWRVFYDGGVTALHLKGASSGAVRSLRVDWQFHRSMVVYHRKAAADSAGRFLTVPLVIAATLGHFALTRTLVGVRQAVGAARA